MIPDHRNVWTDGSLHLDQVTGVSSSGAGFFAHQSDSCWRGRRWGHVDGIRADHDASFCRGFFSIPGPLQSVQRAEMWEVILALQSSSATHLGVDNLGGPTPFKLVNDGDLLLMIERMLHLRGLWTRFGFLMLGVMLMRAWFLTVGFGRLTDWVMDY